MSQTTQGNVDSLVTALTNVLTSIIDKHAPLRIRSITQRPYYLWYIDILHMKLNFSNDDGKQVA